MWIRGSEELVVAHGQCQDGAPASLGAALAAEGASAAAVRLAAFETFRDTDAPGEDSGAHFERYLDLKYRYDSGNWSVLDRMLPRWRFESRMPLTITLSSGALLGLGSLLVGFFGQANEDVVAVATAGFGFAGALLLSAPAAGTWRRPSVWLLASASVLTVGLAVAGSLLVALGSDDVVPLGGGVIAGSVVSAAWLVGGYSHLASRNQSRREFLDSVHIGVSASAAGARVALSGNF
ncbi:MAG: hypothetical protein JRH11_18765 [Deltaproteobacteria bacterium]|nr:hypothetical protein [Deltaproteobacteria bacterium]